MAASTTTATPAMIHPAFDDEEESDAGLASGEGIESLGDAVGDSSAGEDVAVGSGTVAGRGGDIGLDP